MFQVANLGGEEEGGEGGREGGGEEGREGGCACYLRAGAARGLSVQRCLGAARRTGGATVTRAEEMEERTSPATSPRRGVTLHFNLSSQAVGALHKIFLR